MSRRTAVASIPFAILVGAVIGVGHADRPRPMRVLFIGNSYTRFNDLPRMVRSISEAVPGGRPVVASRVTGPGFSLRRHWEHPELHTQIAEGDYDALVLQGRSLGPIEAPQELREYAVRFAQHAQSHGARIVLFETWARHQDHRLYRGQDVHTPDEMLARIEQVYTSLGDELSAPVAPVGRAWGQARTALPRTALHRPDGTHPSVAGTYLSALVLYTTLTGRDPRQTSYRPYPLGRRQTHRIRELVAATFQLEGEPDGAPDESPSSSLDAP